MDLVGWDGEAFRRIEAACKALADSLSIPNLKVIPVSARTGENIRGAGASTPWYDAAALLPCLEGLEIAGVGGHAFFRMPVERVDRSDPSSRGFFGHVACGTAEVGSAVRIVPGGAGSRVKAIVAPQGGEPVAAAGYPVTLCLEDELDASPGDVVASAEMPPELSDQFEARLICFPGHRLAAGRQYAFQLHACRAGATITAIKYRIDLDSGAHLAAKTLEPEEIGVVNLATDRLVAFEPHESVKALGAFLLFDRLSNEAVGAGTIDFALRRAANLRWQAMDLDRSARARMKMQNPACVWLTGLSGSGKSTIANLLERRLFADGRHTYLLDGDNVRHGLNRDLGFTEADRIENIRRISEVSRLMVDAGLIVIVAFISPFRAERLQARSLFQTGEFHEIFVDTPLEECERRDTKGLYAKARRGALKNFTGIDSPYEPPESPEVRIDTTDRSPEDCVDEILGTLGL
jgi:bifunctional enzyme CysN/CysC